MNVKELIEKLQELPPDFEVRTACCRKGEMSVKSVNIVCTFDGNWVWVG